MDDDAGSGLADAVAGWEPGPVETTGSTGAPAVGALSGLFDLDPVAGDGDPLPPSWHWVGFGAFTRQDELGDDGHPRDGHFLPPIPARRRMHAGGRLEVRDPMRVGETLRRRSRLVRNEVKHGRSGPMLLVTVRDEFVRPGEEAACVVEETDHVYRSQEPGGERGLPAGEPGGADDVPATAEAVRLHADATLLFRFSALTHNTHRIHYDQPYVTGVEGYPGLVVHGPLMALLALEIPRRYRPGRAVTRFDYRLRHPAFALTGSGPSRTLAQTPLLADVAAADAAPVDGPGAEGSDPRGDVVPITVGVPGAAPSLTATARLAGPAGTTATTTPPTQIAEETR